MQRPRTVAGEGSGGHGLGAVRLPLHFCGPLACLFPPVPVSLVCDLFMLRSQREGRGTPFHIATEPQNKGLLWFQTEEIRKMSH